MANNEKIKKDVVDNLYWDTRVDAVDVTVDVEDGNVTLSGTVPSYTSRLAAVSSAWLVKGVSSVTNLITVEYPSIITMPSDSEIKSNVENKLLWDSSLNSTKIDVEVKNKDLTLEGVVDSYWKKDWAEDLADVVGVKSIINKIAVVPNEKYDDENIAKDIIDALSRNSIVDVENVEVKVEEGKVTLTGTVSSWTEFNSAENTAYYTVGVTQVENLLNITY
jgi:osmotically-inducible protein OsmY